MEITSYLNEQAKTLRHIEDRLCCLVTAIGNISGGGGGGGVTTMAAIGASPNANGATISGTTLNLQPASASFGGVLTTLSQSIAGAKTFTSLMTGSAGFNLAGTMVHTTTDTNNTPFYTFQRTTGSIGQTFSTNADGYTAIDPLVSINGKLWFGRISAAGIRLQAGGSGAARIEMVDKQANSINGEKIFLTIGIGTDYQSSGLAPGGTCIWTKIVGNFDGQTANEAGVLIKCEHTIVNNFENFGFLDYAPSVISSTGTHYGVRFRPVTKNGFGLGVLLPTAQIHVSAGSATAGTAPIKFTTGTALTTPENGALEYHASHLYFTIGATRYQLDQQSGGGTFSTGLTNTAGIITANLSTGIAGGQSVIGGTAAGNNLTISSTTNGTKGSIIFGAASLYDEVNNYLGIGTTTPNVKLQVAEDLINYLGPGQIEITGASNENKRLILGLDTNLNIGYIQAGTAGVGYNHVVLQPGGANLGIGGGGGAVPTALCHLGAGTASANSSPLKFTSGTNLTTIENGTIEYDGTNYFASAGGTRQTIHKGKAGLFSQVGAATTVFTVTFGGTQPNNTYKVNVTPTSSLSAAMFYVSNKTTTTFDVIYLAGLTGTVTFDYLLNFE